MEQLYKTVDGYGLKSFVNAVVPSEWLVVGVDRMPTQQLLPSQKFALLSYTTGCDR